MQEWALSNRCLGQDVAFALRWLSDGSSSATEQGVSPALAPRTVCLGPSKSVNEERYGNMLPNAVERCRDSGVCQGRRDHLAMSGLNGSHHSTFKSFAQVQNNHGIKMRVSQTQNEACSDTVHPHMDRSEKGVDVCSETMLDCWCSLESPRSLDKVDLEYTATLTTQRSFVSLERRTNEEPEGGSCPCESALSPCGFNCEENAAHVPVFFEGTQDFFKLCAAHSRRLAMELAFACRSIISRRRAVVSKDACEKSSSRPMTCREFARGRRFWGR
jgi:hypothetical protein